MTDKDGTLNIPGALIVLAIVIAVILIAGV
jgi:hypothetical protein